MSLKLLCLTVTIIGLIGCSESENDRVYNQQRRNSSAMVSAQGAGIDTARETVQKAKDFMVQLIANSDQTIFEQFPEGFTKDTISQIIQGLSFSGDDRFRSGEPILMDHNFQDRKLFYSQQFVAKYGNNEAANTDVAETNDQAAAAETTEDSETEEADAEASDESASRDTTQSVDSTDNLQAIQEITELVFQELSHLMGVGRTLQTKNLSIQFAANLLDHLLTETVLCEGRKDNIQFSLAINPQTGMSFYVQNKTIVDFKQPRNYQVARPVDSSSSVWSLGSAFSFFNLQNEEASGALEVAVNKLSPEIGVPLHSSYELIEIFQGVLPSTDHVIFWDFQEGIANQTYRMNYRPEQASARASVEEIGVINLNLQNFSEASLNIEVQKNNMLDETQSFQIPLSCESLTTSFDLQSLLALNESQAASAVNTANPTNTQTAIQTTDSSVQRQVLNQLMQNKGCDAQDLSEVDKSDCEALQRTIDGLE